MMESEKKDVNEGYDILDEKASRTKISNDETTTGSEGTKINEAYDILDEKASRTKISNDETTTGSEGTKINEAYDILDEKASRTKISNDETTTGSEGTKMNEAYDILDEKASRTKISNDETTTGSEGTKMNEAYDIPDEKASRTKISNDETTTGSEGTKINEAYDIPDEKASRTKISNDETTTGSEGTKMNEADDIPDEKSSRMKISNDETTTGSEVTKMNDDSLTYMMSQPKKSHRRGTNVARVVFEEPFSSNEDQKHSTDVSTNNESSKETKTSNYQNVEITSTTDNDGHPSDIDSHDTLKAIEARTKRHLASQAELSRPPSETLKTKEFDAQTARESTRHGPKFLHHKIEEMLAQHPQFSQRKHQTIESHHLDEGELIFPTTTDSSAVTSVTRMRLSDNVGVRSMLFDPPPTDCLPTLEATAFVIILEESLNLLSVLEHVIPARVDERWDESYKTIDEKYGTPEEPNIMYREDMGLLPLVPTVSEKIQRDRTYVYHVLKATARDIHCLRKYDRLETEVDDIVRILEGEHNLEVNYETWMGQVKQLQELIVSNRIKNEENARNLLLSAQKMNAEVDNSIFSNSSKLGYVEQWEDARLEQQKLRLELKEEELNDALGDCTTMERADQIISTEVRIFLEGNTKDLEDDIIAWTSRYNEETERFQQEINNMKEKIELQKLDMQNLWELREERQIFLDKCYEEKKIADGEIEYWEAVNKAATVIQALWRGYMVRHKLGMYKKLWASFNKKKKKKKKPKGKKATK